MKLYKLLDSTEGLEVLGRYDSMKNAKQAMDRFDIATDGDNNSWIEILQTKEDYKPQKLNVDLW